MSYEKIKLTELGKFHKVLPISKQVQEYVQKIKDLQPDEAGHFTAQTGERPGTIKMRLNRASELAGIPIAVRRLGNDVLFYRVEKPEAKEAPKTKGKK